MAKDISTLPDTLVLNLGGIGVYVHLEQYTVMDNFIQTFIIILPSLSFQLF